jgi:hypothetical protein
MADNSSPTRLPAQSDLSVHPATDPHPFPFLDLPKDIRFMVYDLLCSTTTRHYAAVADHDYKVKIVKQHLRVSIILTCGTIYNEAVIIRKALETLKTQPLRLVVQRRHLGCPEMRAVLICASATADPCSGCHELAALFPDSQWPDVLAESAEAFNQLYRARRHTRPVSSQSPSIVQRGFASHEELHTLVARQQPQTSYCIEVAVECTPDDTEHLSQYWQELLYWLFFSPSNYSSEAVGDTPVTYRVKPANEQFRCDLEPWYKDMRDREDLIKRKWCAKGREYEVRDWVLGEEWQDTWAEK